MIEQGGEASTAISRSIPSRRHFNQDDAMTHDYHRTAEAQREDFMELAVVCSACDGTGRTTHWPYSGQCDRCGGSGLRRKCRRADCRVYGCGGYGECAVSMKEAANSGFPLCDAEFGNEGRSPNVLPGAEMLLTAILALALIAAGAWMAFG